MRIARDRTTVVGKSDFHRDAELTRPAVLVRPGGRLGARRRILLRVHRRRTRVPEVSAPNWRWILRWVKCSRRRWACPGEGARCVVDFVEREANRARGFFAGFGPRVWIARVNEHEVFAGLHTSFQFVGRNS